MNAVLLTMLLPFLQTGQDDTQPESDPPGLEYVYSDTDYRSRQKSRLVMIHWDPHVLPLSADSVNLLLADSTATGALRGKFADIEQLEFAGVNCRFKLFESSPEANWMLGQLAISAGKVKATATAVQQWEELVVDLRDQLERVLIDVHNRSLDQLLENLTRARAGAEAATIQLRDRQSLESDLIQKAGGRNLNRQAIFDAVQNLKDRKSTLALQQAGVAARQAAIAKRIAAITEEIKQKQADDPIARELEKIVALHESALKYQQKLVDSQVASQRQTAETEKQLALAKVQLLQHQQDAAQRAGADRLGALNDELAGTSMEIVEIEAQLQIIDRELAEMNPERLLALADQYEREVTMQLPLAQKMLEQAQQRLFEAELRLQSVAEPRVIDLVPGDAE